MASLSKMLFTISVIYFLAGNIWLLVLPEEELYNYFTGKCLKALCLIKFPFTVFDLELQSTQDRKN